MSPVKYELSPYIPEDDILHSHCREKLQILQVMKLFQIRTQIHLQLYTSYFRY
jgi:hypothetical protein